MARSSCKVGGRKQIGAVDVKKCRVGRGKGRAAWCVGVAITNPRPVRKTKGGGRLVDSGMRWVGAFGSKQKAEKQRSKWARKSSVC
mgnify:CR=1 FL=1